MKGKEGEEEGKVSLAFSLVPARLQEQDLEEGIRVDSFTSFTAWVKERYISCTCNVLLRDDIILYF